jgi:integrase
MPRVQQPKPYEKPNGHWYYRVRDEYGRRPERGPFPHQTAAIKDRNKEIARIEKARAQLRIGSEEASVLETQETHTLSDLLDEFEQLYKAAPKTYEDRMRTVKRLRKAPDPGDPSKLFVDRDVTSILPADLMKFINSFPSADTQMEFCKLWSLLLKAGVEHLHWLTPAESPRAGIRWPKVTRPRNRAIWRGPAQVLRIAAYMPQPYASVPHVQAAGGFRTGEVLALRPSWIDRKRRVVSPQHSSWRRAPSPGKKATLPRDLPLTTELERALDAIPDDVWSDELDLCFTDAEGQMLWSGEYARHFRVAVKASGEKPIEGKRCDPYSLRTSHINWHMEAGTVSASDLADYLGTSVKEIERSYNRQTAERRQRNAARLDIVFSALSDGELDDDLELRSTSFFDGFIAASGRDRLAVTQALILELERDEAMQMRVLARVAVL